MRTLRLIVCLLLLPLTVWYAVGVALRNMLYSLGVKKSTTPAVPTVGIGNLRVGGTGKTPHTEHLVRLFADRQTALLSRGYGRQTSGFVLAKAGDGADLLGDEPAMLARKFPALTVAVCEERLEGVRRLMQLPQPPELILLDDVLQHRALRPAVSLLLTEYGDPYFADHILPFGNLREFRTGRRRADIVVVTKCPHTLSAEEQRCFRDRMRLSPSQQLFFSTIDYGQPQPLYPATQGADFPSNCSHILLVTGIAHPQPLVDHLQRQAAVSHLRFADHHTFSTDDGKRIRKMFDALEAPAKAIVTTEKDAVRLLACNAGRQLEGLPVYYLPIAVRLLDGDLRAAIRAVLAAKGIVSTL